MWSVSTPVSLLVLLSVCEQPKQCISFLLSRTTSVIDLTFLDFNMFGIMSLTCLAEGQSKIHYDAQPISSLGQNKISETAVNTT